MRGTFAARAVLMFGVGSIAVLAAYPVVAQNSVFKSGVELVTLTVTVTDRTGRYVPDLTAPDFAIFEDGKPQTVSHFAAGHVSLDVGFLIDTSTSMRLNLPLAQKAACGLVKQLQQGDRGAVAAIASSVSVQQSMTPDLARVDMALRSMQATGSTALYDAVYIMLRQFQQDRRTSSDVRRQVVVLLSDGVDTASHVRFDDVLDLVRRGAATIYVVSLADEAALASDVGDRTLSESAYAMSTLARESGGRLFTARAGRDLSAIYEAIGQELSNQYVLGYVPSVQGDGILRHISVGVLQPRTGVARTRAAYYADGAHVRSGSTTN
jgi:Ca-activated chloride channel homolog